MIFTNIQIIIANMDIISAIIDASFLSFSLAFFKTNIEKTIPVTENTIENGIPKSGTNEHINEHILPINAAIYILFPPL